MTAKFALEGTNKPVLIVEPDFGNEAILMAAFLRYDSNLFRVSVERSESGSIKSVTFISEIGE